MKRKRIGLVFKKCGMSSIFDKDGRRIPVTVLKLLDSCVVGLRTPEVDGYSAVQVGYEECNEKHLNKSQIAFYKKQEVGLYRGIAEFRVEEDALLAVGSRFSVNHFVPNERVDVTAISIGKGFAGAMKRHNFGGLRASHGVSVSHRSHGSTGQGQDPGRVFKGKKMAGHMGNVQVSVQNLLVHSIDEENKLLILVGAVPGHKSSLVQVRDAVKLPMSKTLPFPAGILEKQENTSDNKDEIVRQ